MKKLKKDLQAVSKSLKTLTKKTERLTKAVAKLEKAPAAAKRKPKAKAKTTRKAVAKKKGTAKKKAATLTATDQVLKIINRSKKGVNPQALRKKTGFDDRKITNILHRAFKEGKIKRIGRGVYIGA